MDYTILVAIAGVYLVTLAVSDAAQKYLYETDAVPGLWWRSFVVAIPLGGLLYLLPCRLDVMFTSDLHWTILQSIAWPVLYWYVCRYTAAHAAVVGVISFFLGSWMITMAADSARVWLAGTA